MSEDDLTRARYRRLVRRLESLMRERAVWEGHDNGHGGNMLVDKVEAEAMRREGLPLDRMRRAAREAAQNLGCQLATHLDAAGRLWVCDAAPSDRRATLTFDEAL